MDSKNLAEEESAKPVRRRLRDGLTGKRIRAKLSLGLAILLTFGLIALLADFLAPYDYRRSRAWNLRPCLWRFIL
jgi:hypothetical protein